MVIYWALRQIEVSAKIAERQCPIELISWIGCYSLCIFVKKRFLGISSWPFRICWNVVEYWTTCSLLGNCLLVGRIQRWQVGVWSQSNWPAREDSITIAAVSVLKPFNQSWCVRDILCIMCVCAVALQKLLGIEARPIFFVRQLTEMSPIYLIQNNVRLLMVALHTCTVYACTIFWAFLSTVFNFYNFIFHWRSFNSAFFAVEDYRHVWCCYANYIVY